MTSPAARRQTLDRLAARGTAALKRRHGVVARPAALGLAARWLLFVPAGWLAVRLVAWAFGTSVPPVPLLVLLGLAFVPAVVAYVVVWARARRRRVPREAAIGSLDRAVGARDRLVAADVFLEAGTPTGFMQAAVEDADAFVARALEAEVEAAKPAPAPRARFAIAGVTAVVLLLLAAWVPTASDATGPETARLPETTPGSGPANEVTEPTPEDAPTPPGTGDRDAPEEPRATTTDPEASAPPTQDLPQDPRETEGRTGSGPGAGAQSTSGANDARGVPSNQGPAESTPREPRPTPPATPRDRQDEERPPETPPEADREESGTTAGRGASRGSSRNPVASDWASRDQVSSEDEDLEDDDEEVEDEASDSEARGGVQPSLRDRKPPTSRDLTIGFGNQPDPDADGRGGPSPPKKSRGTASLVLGVPIPDRVRGQLNPGRTRITQERVQPQEEAGDRRPAETRGTRGDGTGPVGTPMLEPWMRRMVRTYFLTLRTQDGTDE